MSAKTLLERLQVKGDRRLAVVDAPEKVAVALGDSAVRAGVEEADVVLVFAANRAQFDLQLRSLGQRRPPTAILWIAYPKLTSKLAGDLSRDAIREAAPSYGLDTVSQIAIDQDWSALRLKRTS